MLISVPSAFNAPTETKVSPPVAPKASPAKPSPQAVPTKKVVSVAQAKAMVAEQRKQMEASVEKKPVVAEKKMEKFGTQAEKAKVIYAFRNGDKHHAGVKITVHTTKFKTFDQV